MDWSYKSQKDCSTGYENILEEMQKITPEIYNSLEQEERQEEVLNIVKLIRNNGNVYPIYYYNEKGIAKEIKKCIDKDVEIKDNCLKMNLNQGQHLCRFIFPNMHKVKNLNDNRNMWNKFYDDHLLSRTIDFILRHEVLKPYSLYRASRLIGGSSATNFPPMKAKALYEKYVPENGIILDQSSGFGGRLLGALSSKNNYTYIGVEPCIETHKHLNELGNEIEKVTNRTNSFKIVNKGSEDFNLHKEYFDFSFTSPPYFNLEVYSDEDTQCYNKFSTLEEWFEGFVRPSIQNAYDMIKKGGHYAVNIADFNIGGNKSKPVHLVNKWLEICEEVGFEFKEIISMKLNPRRYDWCIDENGKVKNKEECIYVFSKN